MSEKTLLIEMVLRHPEKEVTRKDVAAAVLEMEMRYNENNQFRVWLQEPSVTVRGEQRDVSEFDETPVVESFEDIDDEHVWGPSVISDPDYLAAQEVENKRVRSLLDEK